jgi:hypothetical protein
MRRKPSRPVLAILGAGLTLLVALLAWFVPYLNRERETVSAVPVPPPFFALEGVGLEPGREACISEVAFDTDGEVAELTALAGKRSGPPLEVVARGEGYSARSTIEGGYDRPALLRTPLDPPTRSVLGTLCIRNRGVRRPVGLLATSDARTSVPRSTTQVDGEPVALDVSVRLLAAENGSVLNRAGEMLERVAAFKPGLLGTPLLLWLLFLLVAGGVAGGVLYAVSSSFRAPD